MSRSVNELENEALQLPLKDRAVLEEHLINSLDEGEDIDSEELWLQEAEKRYQNYLEGKTTSQASPKVFQDIKSKLK